MTGNFEEKDRVVDTAEQPAEQATEASAKEKKETKKPATKAIKKNVYQKLLAIQTEIKAPKNLYNSFGKYNYRNAESILEAAKPYLAEQECVLIMEDQIETFGVDIVTKKTDEGTITKETPRRYIKAIAHFIDCETGDTITTNAYANECEHTGMSGDQCTGTASSYARKYCLNALFLLDDTKDSDTDEMKNIENNANAKKTSQTNSNANSGAGKGGWGDKRTTTPASEPAAKTATSGWGKPAQQNTQQTAQNPTTGKGWGNKGA